MNINFLNFELQSQNLYMEPSQPEKDISLIKNLMEKSSKFSNLSGYAIATTGLLALLGAVFVYFDLLV